MASLITLPWQFRTNRLLMGSPTIVGGIPKFPPEYLIATAGQNTLWDIKESLRGHGTDWTDLLGAPVATPSGNWAVWYSSDSTVPGTGVAGDGVDHWVTPSNLVNGTGGAVRSWIVLKQPGIAANYQLCIALDSANPYEATVAVSPNAGFTGGTTTARPTATDEIVLVAAGSIGICSLNTAVNRVHVMKSADGSATRVIICRSGYVVALWMLERPSRPVAGWDHPSIAFLSAQSAARPLASQLTQTTLNTQFNAKGRTKDYPAGVAFGNSLAVDYSNGVSPSVLPVPNDIDGTTPFYPIDLVNTSTFTARGRNGQVQDAWYIPWNFQDGCAVPNDDSRQFVLVGLLTMPWNRGPAYWH